MRSAEELMLLREQGMTLTPQEEQKIVDFLADRRGERVPDGTDVADFVVEMLTRAIPGAPAHLLAEASDKLQRIITNERRRARRDAISELVMAGMNEAAAKLEGEFG